MKYYVYAWLREDGSPYYIGKGTGIRAYSNKDRQVTKKPKNEDRIVIMEYFENEEDAYSFEYWMIECFGRKDLGTGCLRNLQAGGTGGSSNRLCSDITKAKMREAAKGRTRSNEAKIKTSIALKGRERTKEHRENLSKANKGKKPCEATLEAARKANTGKIFSEERKLQISEANIGENNHFFGKKHSEESKMKMREAQKLRRERESCPSR